MKRALQGLGVILLLVLLVAVVRGLLLRPHVPEAPATDPPPDAPLAAQHLSSLIRIPTVSLEDAPADTAAFRLLHAYLEGAWPGVHRTLHRATVADLSLLYTWAGQDTTLPPVVLMAHLDVVPVDSLDDWTHPGFSGYRDGHTIWGRGTLDDKGSLVAILETVESLVQSGFTPARTVHLAFGHDEEIGGEHGMAAITALLAARGVAPAWVLDEGGFVTHGAVPGVTRPVAVVGVAEKGYANITLEASGDGGHSSIPPRSMAISNLAAALDDIAEQPMPARLDGATWALFEAVAPHMPLHYRVLFANKWLFGPLIRAVLAGSASTNAVIRTTMAFTMLDAGTKPNVLPDRARAVINFRLMPGDSDYDVVTHLEHTLRQHPNVTVASATGRPAVGVAPTSGPGYDDIVRSVSAAFGDSVVLAPYMTTGGTDAKHFAALTDRIYRFIPFEVFPSRDGILLHGVDERLPEAQLAPAVAFYHALLTDLD
ncbi:MAG: M20/M25/M40 family metallo-hydrolase [Rhodothermales bacterium]|nr:M20/M25/M40 family metallo-hydrolase [Rhodothermales bacterium]MBO6781518.1 M20/M25/M40 family metallo-hydrolase [Rhodothermales bacterium]